MIAVTGAAGFIGSNLAHRLAGDDHELLLVDRNFTPEKSPNLAGLTGYQSLKHDEFLDALTNDRVSPEAIFHLGACSSTTEKNWDFLVENNIRYSQESLELVRIARQANDLCIERGNIWRWQKRLR
jgi:ADP-L-glycero-D-manno-heptose 6-epimerase